MRSQTNELALEQSIEKALTGTTAEELKGVVSEPTPTYGVKNDFYVGFNSNFNKEYAIDEKRFWNFLESTQVDELDKLKRDPQYKLKIIQRLDRMIKKYGILKLLRKGLDVDDAHFTLMFVAPLASSSQAIKKRFDSNEFSVTRQIITQKNQKPDMVIFMGTSKNRQKIT